MEDQTEKMDVPVFQFEDSSLNNRCKDVFGCLDALEAKHASFERTRAQEDAESDKRLIHQGPGHDYYGEDCGSTEFKKPHTPSGRDYHRSKKGGRHDHERTGHGVDPRVQTSTNHGGRRGFRGRYGRGRSRVTPDYKIHPERWTEYSLEDVDISDAANKQAAFAFLEERRAAKENVVKEEKVDVDLSACSSGQITFKRPSKQKIANKSVASIEDKQMEERTAVSVDVDMNEDGKVADESMDTGDCDLKRKFDSVDDTSEAGQGRSEKPAEFKSRKVLKRSIRSRREEKPDEQDSD